MREKVLIMGLLLLSRGSRAVVAVSSWALKNAAYLELAALICLRHNCACHLGKISHVKFLVLRRAPVILTLAGAMAEPLTTFVAGLHTCFSNGLANAEDGHEKSGLRSILRRQ